MLRDAIKSEIDQLNDQQLEKLAQLIEQLKLEQMKLQSPKVESEPVWKSTTDGKIYSRN